MKQRVAHMATSEGVIGRRLRVARDDAMAVVLGGERAWGLALARAARDTIKLPIAVKDTANAKLSLSEVLELPPEKGMIILLHGPNEAIGMLLFSNTVLASLVEIQTIGKLVAQAPTPRKPTRTDASMSRPLVDDALFGFETAVADLADMQWARGFRFASFLDDPRPLALLLEDVPYRVLKLGISMAHGARTGEVILVLPALLHAVVQLPQDTQTPQPISSADFQADLLTQIEGADCILQAVLTRLTLPLCDLMALTPGQVMAFPHASLDRISLEGMDGRKVVGCHLGQRNGMRALRIKDQGIEARQIPKIRQMPSVMPEQTPAMFMDQPNQLRQSA
jgi:flagellar motor switch protein FliM